MREKRYTTGSFVGIFVKCTIMHGIECIKLTGRTVVLGVKVW